jgi:hypothetical protein
MNVKIVEFQVDTSEAKEGSVNLSGSLTLSAPSGGCGSPGCKCSPGWWICATLPMDPSGMVKGFTLEFSSPRDLGEFVEKSYSILGGWLAGVKS